MTTVSSEMSLSEHLAKMACATTDQTEPSRTTGYPAARTPNSMSTKPATQARLTWTPQTCSSWGSDDASDLASLGRTLKTSTSCTFEPAQEPTYDHYSQTQPRHREHSTARCPTSKPAPEGDDLSARAAQQRPDPASPYSQKEARLLESVRLLLRERKRPW